MIDNTGNLLLQVILNGGSTAPLADWISELPLSKLFNGLTLQAGNLTLCVSCMFMPDGAGGLLAIAYQIDYYYGDPQTLVQTIYSELGANNLDQTLARMNLCVREI